MGALPLHHRGHGHASDSLGTHQDSQPARAGWDDGVLFCVRGDHTWGVDHEDDTCRHPEAKRNGWAAS